MPITKSKTPNEFLVRWSDTGTIQGAHIVFREAVIEDGTELSSKLLPTQPVSLDGEAGFPLSDVLAEVQASALATIEARDAEIAALKADAAQAKTDADAALSAANAARDAALAQVANLQAQVAALQPPTDVNGVPQQVTRRQAKTLMELTPHPTAGNLWLAALAAAEAIPDAQTRIVTQNYLMESLYFEYPQVLSMAQSLLGMTAEQVDQMFIAADKL